MNAQEFLFFFMLKSAVTVSMGWICILALDVLGWEKASWPSGGCAVPWLLLSSSLGAIFNWSLNWSTLCISPLTARLSLLLGIPCSFLIDVLIGKRKSVDSWVGVLMLLT